MDDQVGPGLGDDLLKDQQIGRALDDRDPQPAGPAQGLVAKLVVQHANRRTVSVACSGSMVSSGAVPGPGPCPCSSVTSAP